MAAALPLSRLNLGVDEESRHGGEVSHSRRRPRHDQRRHLRKSEIFDASALAVGLLIAVFLHAAIACKLIGRTLFVGLTDSSNIRKVLRPSRCQFCGYEALG